MLINVTGDLDDCAMLVDTDEIAAIDTESNSGNVSDKYDAYYRLHIYLKNGKAVSVEFFDSEGSYDAFNDLSKLWLSTKPNEKELWEVGIVSSDDHGKPIYRRLDENEDISD